MVGHPEPGVNERLQVMAGNENSGRRPRREEERKLIGKHFEEAVSVVVEILKDKKAPKAVRLDAARLLIQHHVGKPTVAAEIDMSSPAADRLYSALFKVKDLGPLEHAPAELLAQAKPDEAEEEG